MLKIMKMFLSVIGQVFVLVIASLLFFSSNLCAQQQSQATLRGTIADEFGG